MKAAFTPTHDEVQDMRRAAYLKKWPVEKQLEAWFEDSRDRPEKLLEMTEDFKRIKEQFPYSRSSNNGEEVSG